MFKKLQKHTHLLHKTGMLLSVICVIHCLATPIIITALPFIAGGWISHNTEIALIIGSVFIALYVLIKDLSVHNNYIPIFLLILAFSIQIVGLFWINEKNETTLLICGSLIMATAYFLNWKFHTKVCSDHHH